MSELEKYKAVASEILEPLGAHVTDEKIGPMGSWHIIYQLSVAELRVVSDRGQVSIDIRKRHSAEWYSFDVACPNTYGLPGAPEEQLLRLSEALPQLEKEMVSNYDQWAEKAKQREQQRTAALISRLKS